MDPMANHGCINGSLDSANYSSPMPLIGIYVAVAALFCLGLMVYDVVVAILARKYWLPSKFFGFNSATMTLLSVAVKLPVDLTTSMPSPQDQLSKLAGTVLVCISMAFLVPSLGANSDSERFTNMVGLSIFVITVAVNIGIQIYTGVIVLFNKEHIIILSFMLFLLATLWHISYTINGEKKVTNGLVNNLLAEGDNNMFERLKLCHLSAYCSDPQFKISIQPANGSVSTISLICSGILVEATIRSLVLKKLEFCQGKSDYDWSILIIVIIQVLTVIVGTVTIVFRWLALFYCMKLETAMDEPTMVDEEFSKIFSGHRYNIYDLSPINRIGLLLMIQNIPKIFYSMMASPWELIRRISNLCKCEAREHSIEFLTSPIEYMAQKSEDDLVRMMDEVHNKKSLNPLLQFLRQEHLKLDNNANSPNRHDSDYSSWCGGKGMQVCSLSIAFLVKIAQASIPDNYLESLLRAFNKVKQIILFIDKKTQPLSLETSAKVAYAKELWTGGDFTFFLRSEAIGTRIIDGIQQTVDDAVAKIKEFKEVFAKKSYTSPVDGMQPNVDDAVARIRKFKEVFVKKSYPTYSEIPVIVDFIDRKSYPSVDDLVKSIEQMFTEMLLKVLSQLPPAIFKMLSEDLTEEFEERLQFAMMSRTLDGRIDWSFPTNTSITSYIHGEINVSHHGAGALKKLAELIASHFGTRALAKLTGPTVPENLNEELSV